MTTVSFVARSGSAVAIPAFTVTADGVPLVDAQYADDPIITLTPAQETDWRAAGHDAAQLTIYTPHRGLNSYLRVDMTTTPWRFFVDTERLIADWRAVGYPRAFYGPVPAAIRETPWKRALLVKLIAKDPCQTGYTEAVNLLMTATEEIAPAEALREWAGWLRDHFTPEDLPEAWRPVVWPRIPREAQGAFDVLSASDVVAWITIGAQRRLITVHDGTIAPVDDLVKALCRKKRATPNELEERLVELFGDDGKELAERITTVEL